MKALALGLAMLTAILAFWGGLSTGSLAPFPPSRAAEMQRQLLKQYPMVVSADPTGRWVLLKSREPGSFSLLRHDRRTARTTPIDRSNDTQLSLTWSPDGRWIGFQEAPSGNGRFSLWTLEPETSRRRKLSTVESLSSAPRLRFRPDGNRLAFLAVGSGKSDLRTVGLVPGDTDSIAIADVAPGSQFDWSPDGNRLAAVDGSREGELILLDLTTKKLTRHSLFEGGEIRDLTWSPEENSLYLSARTSPEAPYSIYRWEAARSWLTVIKRSASDLRRPRWLAGRLWYHEEARGISRLTGDSGQIGEGEMLETSIPNELFFLEKTAISPPAIAIVDLSSAKVKERLSFSEASVCCRRAPGAVTIPRSDEGPELSAYLWKNESRKTKAVLLSLQGGVTPAVRPDWNAGIQALVDRGVTYLGVSVREPGGAEDHLADARRAARFALDMGRAENVPVYLQGSSYGAYLAACSLIVEPRLAGGFLSSVPDTLPDCPRPATPLTAPRVLMAFHGENDPLTAPGAALRWLATRISPSPEFHILPREGHNFHSTQSWSEIYGSILDVTD